MRKEGAPIFSPDKLRLTAAIFLAVSSFGMSENAQNHNHIAFRNPVHTVNSQSETRIKAKLAEREEREQKWRKVYNHTIYRTKA
jgi:hypothetical protein